MIAHVLEPYPSFKCPCRDCACDCHEKSVPLSTEKGPHEQDACDCRRCECECHPMDEGSAFWAITKKEPKPSRDRGQAKAKQQVESETALAAIGGK